MQVKKMGRFLGAGVFATLLMATGDNVFAAEVTWDLSGEYLFGYGVQGESGVMAFNVANWVMYSGAFTATTSTPETTITSAEFDGSRLNFAATFVGLDSLGSPLTCYYIFAGTVDMGGLFSGDMGRNCAGHGFLEGVLVRSKATRLEWFALRTHAKPPPPSQLRWRCSDSASAGYIFWLEIGAAVPLFENLIRTAHLRRGSFDPRNAEVNLLRRRANTERSGNGAVMSSPPRKLPATEMTTAASTWADKMPLSY